MVVLNNLLNTANSDWSPDYLALLAKRWQLNKRKMILEVGCGQGLWTGQLLPFLPKNADVNLLDLSPIYLNKAKINFKEFNTQHIFSYYLANGKQLPFKDNTFDLVTCHRVLMHIDNPLLVISEMKRVLKPCGIAVILEPNSLGRSIGSYYRREIKMPEHAGTLSKFQEIIEYGKKQLGEGDNSIGEEVAMLMQHACFNNIETKLNDNVKQLLPNQKTSIQNSYAKEIKEWFQARFYSILEISEAEKYFLASGRTLNEFRYYKSFIEDLHQIILDKINKEKAHIIINDIIYITWGYK